ncbi:bicyclomycin resistance protein, partial [Brucella oryzae]
MSINKWKAGLLAGLSILALSSVANAGEVRMTVAEYSSKTGPYFEEVKKAF